MLTAQLTIITIPNRTYEEIVNQINGMPQLSVGASNILHRISTIATTEFSKDALTSQITKLETSNTKFHHLEENEFCDRSKALSRCALNTLFFTGVPLSIGLIPNLIGQIVGGVVCTVACVFTGSVNMAYADDPPFTDNTDGDEEGTGACYGVCFGPCFARYEATHQIPLRIDLARNDAAAQEAALRQSFENLLQFCLDDGATSKLQRDLRANITKLENLIRKHDEDHTTSAQLTAVSLYSENISEKKFSETKLALGKQKASYERVSSELNTFVQYFKEKNPS